MRFRFPGKKSNLTLDVFEPVESVDPRYKQYATGITVKRPEDKRGDSVNHLTVGGRLDVLSEMMDQHVENARAEQDADIAIAAVLYPNTEAETA